MAMLEVGLKEPGGNSLFSPMSILTTINMLLLGTKGQTKEEIMQALGDSHSTNLIHPHYSSFRISTLHCPSPCSISEYHKFDEQ